LKKSGMELTAEEDEAVRRFFFGFAFEETGFLDGTEEDEELSLPLTDDGVSLELELLSSANAFIDV
jgi:hypothetical protein